MPTPSEVARAAPPRWLVILHRYLGVSIGVLVLLWCLSGIAMIFVRWPSVTEAERAERLSPIAWQACCAFAPLDPALEIESARVEMLLGRPVLRLQDADGERRVLDLVGGGLLRPLRSDEAVGVAQTHTGLKAQRAVFVERDQWTITGDFNARRPFWRVDLADAAGTQVHVSQASGEVAQATTRASRMLSWLGPIPHWLYPSLLRANVKLWTQVVIWTSLAGVFLTVTGLYLGLVAWRPWRDARLSPYRGLMSWHHLAGLATGLLTLTWVASGLASMNPWGLLESSDDLAAARLRGPAPTYADLTAGLARLAHTAPSARQVRLAPLGGQVAFMAGETRFDAAGRPAPLATAGLADLAHGRLGPARSVQLITTGDAYYYPHHEAVRPPALRVIGVDGVRRYLDPGSGEVLATVDAPAKGYRWLHLFLHRLDVVPATPVWAALTTALLLLVSAAVGLGVALAWQRLRHDLRRR